MPDEDSDQPAPALPASAAEKLRRIETLLETAVKELRQIRAIVAKRRENEAAPAS